MLRECSIPFRHWIVDDAVESELFTLVSSTPIPDKDWPAWCQYENMYERKYACADICLLPRPFHSLFVFLTQNPLTQKYKTLAGIDVPLFPDPTWHGAGLHVTLAGGHLSAHIDYALHPHLNLERRMSSIYFISGQDDAGGELCFWDDTCREIKTRISPKPNRLVLWESSDIAYHSVSPLKPGAGPRVTAAVYYLSPPRPGVVRKRALFCPQR